MQKFKLNKVSLSEAVRVLEQISPRKYWLHNRVGGQDWTVTFGKNISVEIQDPKMATWALLKLKQ